MADSHETTPSEMNGLETEVNSGYLCEARVKVHEGWRSRMRTDLVFRRKVLQNIWICIAFFALSVAGGQLGPAFIDLQTITNASVQQASIFFTAGSAGYLAGSLLSGFVYDLLSKSLWLIVCLLGCGAMTGVMPYCRQYWLMVTVTFLAYYFAGSVDTVGNTHVLRMWEGKGEVALQAIYFTYAVGSVVAPLITEPFLTPTAYHGSFNNSTTIIHLGVTAMVNTSSGNGSSKTPWVSSVHGDSDSSDDFNWQAIGNFSDYVVTVTTDTLINAHLRDNKNRYKTRNEGSERDALVNDTVGIVGAESDKETDHLSRSSLPQDTRVHYAFLIAALMMLLSALPFIGEYIVGKKWRKMCQRKTQTRQNNQKSEVGTKSRSMQLPRFLYTGTLLWTCGFFVVYYCVEFTFSSFLTFYAVDQMGWSKSTGALLTSVFFIFFAASRFACIFLIKLFTSAQLLMTCFTLLILSLLGFLLSSLWHLHWGVWVSSAGAGAATSTIFPSGLCWMDKELIPVTGRVMSAVMLAASVGSCINPLILGHLMETEGTIWMAYLLLGEATLCVLTFAFLLLFTRLYLQTAYANPTSRHDVSLNVTTDKAPSECSQQFLGHDHELVSRA